MKSCAAAVFAGESGFGSDSSDWGALASAPRRSARPDAPPRTWMEVRIEVVSYSGLHLFCKMSRQMSPLS